MARPRKGGVPPTYKTAEELQKKLDAYFADCDANGESYNEFSLGLYLGVTVRTLESWFNGERCPWLRETIEFAYMRISAQICRNAEMNPKSNIPIFLLKQKRYGGYQDKIESKADVTVNVHMGKGMEASDFE